MDYEAVLELYRAGFPKIEHDSDSINPAYPTYITLDELIRECGFAFLSLEQTSGVMSMRTLKTLYWEASGYKKGKVITSIGHTPEYALGRLWLALNKKEV